MGTTSQFALRPSKNAALIDGASHKRLRPTCLTIFKPWTSVQNRLFLDSILDIRNKMTVDLYCIRQPGCYTIGSKMAVHPMLDILRLECILPLSCTLLHSMAQYVHTYIDCIGLWANKGAIFFFLSIGSLFSL